MHSRKTNRQAHYAAGVMGLSPTNESVAKTGVVAGLLASLGSLGPALAVVLLVWTGVDFLGATSAQGAYRPLLVAAGLGPGDLLQALGLL